MKTFSSIAAAAVLLCFNVVTGAFFELQMSGRACLVLGRLYARNIAGCYAVSIFRSKAPVFMSAIPCGNSHAASQCTAFRIQTTACIAAYHVHRKLS